MQVNIVTDCVITNGRIRLSVVNWASLYLLVGPTQLFQGKSELNFNLSFYDTSYYDSVTSMGNLRLKGSNRFLQMLDIQIRNEKINFFIDSKNVPYFWPKLYRRSKIRRNVRFRYSCRNQCPFDNIKVRVDAVIAFLSTYKVASSCAGLFVSEQNIVQL